MVVTICFNFATHTIMESNIVLYTSSFLAVDVFKIPLDLPRSSVLLLCPVGTCIKKYAFTEEEKSPVNLPGHSQY